MPTDNVYNEVGLLSQIAEGNEAAFSQVFLKYKDKLYSAAYSLTRSEETAEEILQDVFLKLWLRRTGLGTIQSLENYLFIMLRNEVFDWFKKQARQQAQQASFAQQQANADTENIFHTKTEAADIVEKGLCQLPARQQEVFRLVRQQGLSREEAARQMGIDSESVKTHLSRAIKNLRAWCMAHGAVSVIVTVALNFF